MRWLVIGLGLLVVATIVFPSVKPADVLATLGVGSVAIGFAFKDILQNWLSGLLLLYRRPFRQGDQIVSGEFEGTVEHIEARATLIRTYDGQRVVIPNADIYTRAVTVRTAFPKRGAASTTSASATATTPSAPARVIVEALGGVEGVERDPAPEAFPWALDASSVLVKVRWWSDTRAAERRPRPGAGRSAQSAGRWWRRASTCRSRRAWCSCTTRRRRATATGRASARAGRRASDPPRPRHLNEVRVEGPSPGQGAPNTVSEPAQGPTRTTQ